MGAEAVVVFTAVVGARFLVPLLIPRYPLPAIVAALILDGIDQTIFQWFGYDPPGYQGYDKAMDVYYLAIAYLTTLRNWPSRPAVDIARFLYFYRLVGVVAFELTEWRPLLMIFPNTFEYFFIAYEIVRLRRDPTRYGMRFWLYTAAAIWIFIKLPQEYWTGWPWPPGSGSGRGWTPSTGRGGSGPIRCPSRSTRWPNGIGGSPRTAGCCRWTPPRRSSSSGSWS
jgi:hypothetical protein